MSRVVGLALLVILAGCTPRMSPMSVGIENRGAPVNLHLLCGSWTYDYSLAATARVSISPPANSCTLAVDGPRAGHDLVVYSRCRVASCNLNVDFTPGAGVTTGPTAIAGTGALSIIGGTSTTTAMP